MSRRKIERHFRGVSVCRIASGVQRRWVVPGKTALRTVAAKHWRGIWVVKMTPHGILAAQYLDRKITPR
jgi:hypothetical protein